MNRIMLNDGWALREAPLHYGAERSGWVASRTDGWLASYALPLDIHTPLMDAGIIKDPVLADYSFDSEWVEERSWWFRNNFCWHTPDADMPYASADLVLESLDVHADVFLNGNWLGHHESAHYPFRCEVSELLVSGENTLLIRLTSGLEHVNDADLAEINGAVSTEANNGCASRGDKRRAFVRKPTYVYGWDWSPRIPTVAIAKGAYLDCSRAAGIRSVSVHALDVIADGTATVHAEMEIELFDITASADADVVIELSIDGHTAACWRQNDTLLRSGINYITTDIPVEHARLWWPNGMGEQPLYTVNASVTCRGICEAYSAFNIGIRTVALDTSRAEGGKRHFAFVVNGTRIFCKGANWIPADAVYARLSDEKYDALINEAAAANFNMLRIWGGGLYERDAFYDACDRRGILVWQDMMFACAAYPDHLQAFYDLTAREFDYQTKRLASRACLTLFCGNNENHGAIGDDWWSINGALTQSRQFGLKISNVLLPEYVRKNAPWIPCWNSSPYGGEKPGSYDVGDVHYWGECMMNADMAKRVEPREFDKVTARFVSEYGYPGPCARESIETYFDGKPVERGSEVWNHHNNTFEKHTVAAGIRKHFTDKDPLTLDEYLLYAGAVQSLMLEYSLESMRFKDFCNGGLFWMYNDCWGEVGWTIIDYYLRRKPSFYGVKRAFAPVKLIAREDDGNVVIMGYNDTDTAFAFDLRCGYISFDGAYSDMHTEPAHMPARSRTRLAVFSKNGQDPTRGVWCAIPVKKPTEKAALLADAALDVRPALLRPFDVKPPAPPALHVDRRAEGNDVILTVTADAYNACVCLIAPSQVLFNDNGFALLPGESRDIYAKNGADTEITIRVLGS